MAKQPAKKKPSNRKTRSPRQRNAQAEAHVKLAAYLRELNLPERQKALRDDYCDHVEAHLWPADAGVDDEKERTE